MNKTKVRMIEKAQKRHKKIFPCAHKEDFEDCFTNSSDYMFFWYNTEDNSTHVIAESVRKRDGR